MICVSPLALTPVVTVWLTLAPFTTLVTVACPFVEYETAAVGTSMASLICLTVIETDALVPA